MKAVSPEANFPVVEKEILNFWDREKIFEKQNSNRNNAKEFSFYDGPPFANGLPHYGHLLANTIKDTVTRYWIMRGFRVDRRFGWDCHGVPVEYEIEKKEGIKGRYDIIKLGISKFNEACRASALHYSKEWKKTITNLGRWVDWNNQYRTMDKDFMESVWWVFSELFKKGLVYRGYKVVPYSPRITTVLSNFEANQNYKNVQDPAITIKFKAKDEDAFFLAWTTTPWTLISNLALAIGPEITYVKIKDHTTNEIYYLAESRLEAVYKPQKGDTPYQILEKLPAAALKGRAYEPLFPYFSKEKNAFKILLDSYVTTDEGTGIVHQAPAYGEDDFRVCRANGIEIVDPLDVEGNFTEQVPDFKGLYIKDADKDIIKTLKSGGKILRHETLVHAYPYCDRTDTPLIYRAIPAWYVAVEKIKDRLVANNQKINWIPSHLRDGRMGKWLENARDWAISRNRFWGTPLPIWMCDKDESHIKVIGSVKELEEKTGEKISDLHKHFIDHLQFGCDKCSGKMKRIEEVFDCWFESGSMPYAQIHYPHENQEKFKASFPADFIAEGLDQTRGWFYTLNILATALFNQPAFKNVIVNGIILDESGQKMSKRKQNYTPPDKLLEAAGADSVRLYMLNSAVLRAEDLMFTDRGVKETTRAVLLPLWNAHSFLTTYAHADGWSGKVSLVKGDVPKNREHELDRWIISRFQTLASKVQERMELYQLYAVVPAVLDFIEDLTNWYIRLSRRRFWGDASEDEDAAESVTVAQKKSTASSISADTEAAYETLFYILTNFTKVFAPFGPFASEKIYHNLVNGLKGVPESVHLCDIPSPKKDLIDEELEVRMDLVRKITNLGRSIRAKQKIKVRQPLSSMLVITRNPGDKDIIDRGSKIIKDELNIKHIDFSTDETQYVRLSIKPNLKTLGKKLGKKINELKTLLNSLNENPEKSATFLSQLEKDGSVRLFDEDMALSDFLVDRNAKDGHETIATELGITVLLNTDLTDELISEGLSREVVNRIQRLRKQSGLQVSDRIALEVSSSKNVIDAVQKFKDYISQETLASKVHVSVETEPKSKEATQFGELFDIEGAKAFIGISKA